MGPSTFISAALHVAIVLFAIVGLSSSHMSAPLVAVPVDLSTTADITKIKAGMKDAKDDAPLAAKPEEKKPQAVKEKTAKAPEQTAAIKKPEKTAEAPKPPAPKPAAKAPEAKPEKTAEAPKPQPKPAAPVRKPEPPKQTAKADTAETGAQDEGLRYRPHLRAAQQDSRMPSTSPSRKTGRRRRSRCMDNRTARRWRCR